MAAKKPTLVLGGGGVSGIAWETGILTGLEAGGVPVRDVEAILGTSAGSAVGAQVGSGLTLTELYARQRAGSPGELSASFGGLNLLAFIVSGILPGREDVVLRRIGRQSARVKTVPPAERRAAIQSRLPESEWPGLDLRIVVVDADAGTTRVITKADGIPLLDAVGASCAVPFVWPAVQVEGRNYIDGGTRSPVNLDLAPGSGPVIVLAPVTAALRRASRISEQRKSLGDRPVVIIEPSAASKAAMGRNSLDKSVVPATALAGFEQGRAEAQRVLTALGR